MDESKVSSSEEKKDATMVKEVIAQKPIEGEKSATEPVTESVQENPKEEIAVVDAEVVKVESEKDKIAEFVKGKIDSPEEGLIANFGRDEEDFVLLYCRDYGAEKEAQYAKEIAGLGCILRIVSEYSGVKTESSVFVPGASIIDLYENHEDKSIVTGRTIAKK